jgi:hypothetical protein
MAPSWRATRRTRRAGRCRRSRSCSPRRPRWTPRKTPITAAARDRLAAEDKSRRDAQRAKQQAWDAAATAGKGRSGRRPGDQPRTNRNNTPARADTTDPDVRVMRNQKGYVSGYNGQLVVTGQQVIVGAMLSQHPVDRTLLHPLLDQCQDQLTAAGIRPKLRTVLADTELAAPGASPAHCGVPPARLACGRARWQHRRPGNTGPDPLRRRQESRQFRRARHSPAVPGRQGSPI